MLGGRGWTRKRVVSRSCWGWKSVMPFHGEPVSICSTRVRDTPAKRFIVHSRDALLLATSTWLYDVSYIRHVDKKTTERRRGRRWQRLVNCNATCFLTSIIRVPRYGSRVKPLVVNVTMQTHHDYFSYSLLIHRSIVTKSKSCQSTFKMYGMYIPN